MTYCDFHHNQKRSQLNKSLKREWNQRHLVFCFLVLCVLANFTVGGSWLGWCPLCGNKIFALSLWNWLSYFSLLTICPKIDVIFSGKNLQAGIRGRPGRAKERQRPDRGADRHHRPPQQYPDWNSPCCSRQSGFRTPRTICPVFAPSNFVSGAELWRAVDKSPCQQGQSALPAGRQLSVTKIILVLKTPHEY